MTNKVNKHESDYAKDKFASKNFLGSLMFWTVLVILTIAYILWKNYPK